MPWFNVDDQMHSHPKVLTAGNAAIGLWTRLGSYASAYATEGFIPTEIVHAYGKKNERNNLITAGLLVPENDGYRLHDYLDYNRDREQIENAREQARERKRRQRERQKESQGHGVTSPVTSGVSHGPQAKPSQAKPTTTDSSPTSAAATTGDVTLPAAAAEAVEILIEHHIAIGKARNASSYRHAMPARLAEEHGPALIAKLDQKPELTGAQLANRVLGISELELHHIGHELPPVVMNGGIMDRRAL